MDQLWYFINILGLNGLSKRQQLHEPKAAETATLARHFSEHFTLKFYTHNKFKFAQLEKSSYDIIYQTP